jgi:hypothetical protein
MSLVLATTLLAANLLYYSTLLSASAKSQSGNLGLNTARTLNETETLAPSIANSTFSILYQLVYSCVIVPCW